jgi:hypothetical protein
VARSVAPGAKRRIAAGWIASVTLFFALLLEAHESHTWKFMVFGDSRGSYTQINTDILNELSREVTNQGPAFLLFAGDLVYTGELPAFQQWSNIMAPVYAAGIKIYPVMGSHDIPDLNAYLQVFGGSIPSNGPPGEIGATYAVVHRDALILALDNNVNASQVNQSWIDSVLATNTRPHVFAMGHEPAFKVHHEDCLDDFPAERDAFWQSLRKVHCRAYFAGHDHFYDHARLDDGDGNPENDVHQFIVGTAGAPLHPDGAYDGINDFWTPQRLWHEEQFGYVVAEIHGRDVRMTWWHRAGDGVYAPGPDVFVYTAPEPDVVLRYAFSKGRLVLRWPKGRLQHAASITGPYRDVPRASSPYVVRHLTKERGFFRVRIPSDGHFPGGTHEDSDGLQ